MFGAAKHFVPKSREGETNNPYHNIQEMYVGNLQKLRSVRDCAKKYHMMDPLRIPVMIDSLTTEPADRWGDETTKRDFLTHWSQVDVADIIAFHQDTNQYASDADTTSSNWLKDLLMNSSEPELLERVT